MVDVPPLEVQRHQVRWADNQDHSLAVPSSKPPDVLARVPQSVVVHPEPHDVSRLTQGQPRTPVLVEVKTLSLPGVVTPAPALLLPGETESNVGYQR